MRRRVKGEEEEERSKSRGQVTDSESSEHFGIGRLKLYGGCGNSENEVQALLVQVHSRSNLSQLEELITRPSWNRETAQYNLTDCWANR